MYTADCPKCEAPAGEPCVNLNTGAPKKSAHDERPTSTTVIVDLPRIFYDDHVSRDLPAGTILKELARKVRVELNQDELSEMKSDAKHYATMDVTTLDAQDKYARGVCFSARSAMTALEGV